MKKKYSFKIYLNQKTCLLHKLKVGILVHYYANLFKIQIYLSSIIFRHLIIYY